MRGLFGRPQCNEAASAPGQPWASRHNAAKSPPDGYTIVTGDNGAMVFHTAMYKKVPYDPAERVPIGFMARFPLNLAVNPNAGFTSAKQLIDELKKNPGKYSAADQPAFNCCSSSCSTR